MEKRVHNEVETLETPTGMIPKYEDLKPLFKEVLGKEYTENDYVEQFTYRVPENIAKIDRIVAHYKKYDDGSLKQMFEILDEQKQRLLESQKKHGDRIPPSAL